MACCEFESHPGPNSVASQISQNIEISLCISHSESLHDSDYPHDLWIKSLVSQIEVTNYRNETCL